MVSSNQTRDLECFADSGNIPWNPPTTLCPDLIATIPKMSLLSLCALLFLQSHLFLICVALTYNDSRIIPRKTCLAPGTSLGSSGFLRSFCFARVGLFPLCCQVLCHFSVSMSVARFTFFTENFVICSDQVTKKNPLWARLYQRVFLQEALVSFVF